LLLQNEADQANQLKQQLISKLRLFGVTRIGVTALRVLMLQLLLLDVASKHISTCCCHLQAATMSVLKA
jgi:hypothetical protein